LVHPSHASAASALTSASASLVRASSVFFSSAERFQNLLFGVIDVFQGLDEEIAQDLFSHRAASGRKVKFFMQTRNLPIRSEAALCRLVDIAAASA
jgi:hypothetical protein